LSAIRYRLKQLIKQALAAQGYQIIRSHSPLNSKGGKAANTPTLTVSTSQTATLEWLKAYNIGTFIDIGAYVGEYVDFAQRFFPGTLIYAFEPLADGYAILQQKASQIPELKVFNYALGNQNTTQLMYKSSYAPSSSLLKMASLHKTAFPHTAGEQMETVTVRRLDDICQDLLLRPNIFVKIDTQGYEDQVIAGGKEVLSRATLIQIETSFDILYEGQALFDEIYSQLYSLGFAFRGVKNQICSPSDGSILQAHAYFIKKNWSSH
jgi:FkbM family methyltransferase